MAGDSEEHEAEVERLYSLPLAEFTPARDELAREHRRAGDREGADEIKRLRKPSAAAWALNQVRRNRRDETDELLQAGARLREAQQRLLAGEGREPFEQALADERRLVDELAADAEHELTAAGQSPTSTTTERLRATLHAVASDPAAREEFAAGRLVRDYEPSGLELLTQANVSSGPASGVRAKQTRGSGASATRGGGASGAHGGGASAARGASSGAARGGGVRAARDRQRAARRLEGQLDRARARQQELEEKRAEAERRLRDARTAAARAASELERAEAAEEGARDRAEVAADTVTELERQLREATAGRGE